MDYDPERTMKATQKLLKVKKQSVLKGSNGVSHLTSDPPEHVFHLLKTKPKAPKQVATAGSCSKVKAWQSSSREDKFIIGDVHRFQVSMYV